MSLTRSRLYQVGHQLLLHNILWSPVSTLYFYFTPAMIESRSTTEPSSTVNPSTIKWLSLLATFGIVLLLLSTVRGWEELKLRIWILSSNEYPQSQPNFIGHRYGYHLFEMLLHHTPSITKHMSVCVRLCFFMSLGDRKSTRLNSSHRT